MTPTPAALRDLSDPESGWRPFVTAAAGTVAGHVLGNHYVAVTDVNVPRGRVVQIPLDSATPNDPGSWQEMIAESSAVIRTLTPIGDQLYVTDLIDIMPERGSSAATARRWARCRCQAKAPSRKCHFP